jgi:hypothetical protein
MSFEGRNHTARSADILPQQNEQRYYQLWYQNTQIHLGEGVLVCSDKLTDEWVNLINRHEMTNLRLKTTILKSTVPCVTRNDPMRPALIEMTRNWNSAWIVGCLTSLSSSISHSIHRISGIFSQCFTNFKTTIFSVRGPRIIFVSKQSRNEHYEGNQ